MSGNGDSTLRDAGPGAGDAIRRDLDSAFARLEEMRLQTGLLAEGLREVEEAKAASDGLARELREENAQLVEQLDRAREDRARIQDLLEQSEATLAGVLGGASWRLTAPLRALRRLRR